MSKMSWSNAGWLGTLILSLMLAGGCTGVNLNRSTPDVTNAPAAGFENVQPGTEEEFILNVGRRTYFARGSADLDETAKMTLNKQIEWLKRNRRWLIKLQGFADDPGTDAQIVALSRRRAEAVMNYLAAGGIDKNRMWAKGYGKERIVRNCPEEACAAPNRRVISNLREEKDGAA